MSNSLVLEQLNLRSNTPAKKLKLSPKKKKKKKEWWQILLGALFGIFSIAAEIVATAFLGPVGGMIVGVVADVSTNVATDLVNGENPFEMNNLVFNMILPICSIPTKAFSAMKMSKNPIHKIGNYTKNKKISKLANKLNQIDFDDSSKRTYQKILDNLKINKDDLSKINIQDLKSVKFIDDLNKAKYEKLDDFNFFLRKLQKGLSLIDDPNYVPKIFSKWLAKITKVDKLINKVNKPLLKLKKKINTKFFKNHGRKISKMIIPFKNHTIAPWIDGIRLYPIKGSYNHYHVTIFFNKSLTNNKQPISIYNKSWKFIYSWLTASSCGQFYINRISWGWDVGKMIRVNSSFLSMFETRFMKSAKYQTLYLAAKNITKLASVIQKCLDHSIVDDFYKAYSIDNLSKNITYGVVDNLKVGGMLIKKGIRSLQTGQKKHIEKFLKTKTQNFIEKKIKDQIISIKSGKGTRIGVKYKYKFS